MCILTGMVERGSAKYKVSEHSTSSWWGGEVSLDPFVQALHQLVLNQYRSRLEFARALGQNNGGTMSRWYRSEHVPSPENFGKILILLDPNEEEREQLVCSYARLIAQGKGVPSEKEVTAPKTPEFYSGAAAGRILGLSRERIRQLRNKFDLEGKLKEDDINMLRDMGYGSKLG